MLTRCTYSKFYFVRRSDLQIMIGNSYSVWQLTRNLADFPFISRTTEADRAKIEKTLHSQISALQESSRLVAGTRYFNVEDLEEVDRQFLVERQLVSVMLHLPALVITRQIEKVFKSLQKINLAVRGLYGEGSTAMGDFYQISNQITLGMTEEELTKKVAETWCRCSSTTNVKPVSSWCGRATKRSTILPVDDIASRR